ncbi:Lipopolysaccharide core heptosyltransferase RfaQ [Stratiformator vulcanicus]|uniref:lipopolysaccharide heptosyltransferase II n=2 Tax=Stratiformator vulcanicus TaxID=2527980 RepID=A0A517R1R7_9PLAN|nr:Lipopolysaccharide core heptosyltransferase RfaQ [Stratiformator vulcanicus]
MPRCLADVDPERIAIIKPSALGDVVQSLPLLPILKERYPHASITWVIRDSLAGLLERHPLIDRLILYRRKGGPSDWVRMAKELRAAKFDLVLDLQGLLRTGLMTLATGSPVRVGLETAREGSHLTCTEIIPNTSRFVPAHQRYWRIAEAIGCGELRSTATIRVAKTELDAARELLSGLRGAVLAVAPGTVWETKRWPVDRFAAVCAKAYRQYGCSTVILGAPNEASLGAELERTLSRFVPRATVLNLAGQTSLQGLAALLATADIALTNDSGPMHIAAAVGTPVCAVFTCTDPQRSGPRDEHFEFVQTGLSCGGSYHRTCPHRGTGHLACHSELEVGRVFAALHGMVQKHLTGNDPLRQVAA